jgi:hypothetical protein
MAHDIDTMLLTGASGLTYEFKVFDPDAKVPATAGVFVVSSRDSDREADAGRPVWLVGCTPNLARTLDQVKRHARLARSATRWRYCIHIEHDQPSRHGAIAKDLAAFYRFRRPPGEDR